MNKSLLALILFILSGFYANAQDAILKGTITDAVTGETLIQANIKSGEQGTVTDYDGKYQFELSSGNQEIVVSYIGYKPQTITANLSPGNNTLNFALEEDNVMMQEINVVADVARSRETPVAFSTVQLARIKEELSTQDLPMVLNSTPGVYATQQGGGDGDARITIRGFNQRNVAIMIDGVPVNDMENGWVYWSNWSGLSEVARSIQVQRGLGASKLALPSVGGTINILTSGIESKRRLSVQQDLGMYGFYKTTLSGTTGRLKGGWGITFTASYRQNQGWVDNTWSKAWFYFGKIEKIIGKHTIGISAVGAPQEHAQRTFKLPIAKFNQDVAADLGVDTSALASTQQWDLGERYNSHWGYLNRWTLNGEDTVFEGRKAQTERLNYYHKPQFTLKDFWTVNKKLSISNIFYVSLGNGGGVANAGSTFPVDSEGLINYQTIYNSQSNFETSSRILRSSVNNHRWYGLLSTFDYNPNNHFNVSGGVDLRTYTGSHYREVYDLLGGKYHIDNDTQGRDLHEANGTHKVVGDKVDLFYDGKVNWGGGFAQVEYKSSAISAFVNLTGAITSYKRIDYFLAKDLVLPDTTILQAVTYYIPYVHQGDTFTIDSPEARYSETETQVIPGYTVKAGMNYNLTEKQNVFFNIGYIEKAPPFDNVFNRNNSAYENVVKERIMAGEIGYGFKSRIISANLNAYYTLWLNRPLIANFRNEDDEVIQLNVEGIKAHHRGVELDFAVIAIPNMLKFEGLASVGDWIWKNDSDATLKSEDATIEAPFSANGVHVGDAAQLQFGLSTRIEPVKNLYATIKWTYFGKNYADFSPDQLTGANEDRESWKMPDYYLFDVHSGYSFNTRKVKYRIGLSLLNALNQSYISDASTRLGFEPQDIEVYFGQGLRLSGTFGITF